MRFIIPKSTHPPTNKKPRVTEADTEHATSSILNLVLDYIWYYLSRVTFLVLIDLLYFAVIK